MAVTLGQPAAFPPTSPALDKRLREGAEDPSRVSVVYEFSTAPYIAVKGAAAAKALFVHLRPNEKMKALLAAHDRVLRNELEFDADAARAMTAIAAQVAEKCQRPEIAALVWRHELPPLRPLGLPHDAAMREFVLDGRRKNAEAAFPGMPVLAVQTGVQQGYPELLAAIAVTGGALEGLRMRMPAELLAPPVAAQVQPHPRAPALPTSKAGEAVETD